MSRSPQGLDLRLNVASNSRDRQPQHRRLEEDRWYLSILKGMGHGSEVGEGDMVSAIQFNECGDMLASGDKAGRVVLFRRVEVDVESFQNNDAMDVDNADDDDDDDDVDCDTSPSSTMDYFDVYCSFTAHEPEFDYLKSLEIDEKVNKIEFLKGTRRNQSILTCNDKTIKLWRLRERQIFSEGSSRQDFFMSGSLTVPRIRKLENPVVTPVLRTVYKNGHMYHLNSISLFPDGEMFLSSDDLRVNCWHLDYDNELFQIVDLKPKNMDSLTEVITASVCHPFYSHLFAFTSSKGILRLCDTRTQALCDRTFRPFEHLNDSASPKGFFSEIIGSMSDVKFGNVIAHDFLMATRDYLTIKIWDSRQNSSPLEIYNVHEHIRPLLCALYENDAIFDKFDCSFSADDQRIVTGSYGHLFSCVNRQTQTVSVYEATVDNANYATQLLNDRRNQDESNRLRIKLDETDFVRKVMHCAFSPRGNMLTVAASCNLFFYTNRSHLALSSPLSSSSSATIATSYSTRTSSSSQPISDLVTPILLTRNTLNYETAYRSPLTPVPEPIQRCPRSGDNDFGDSGAGSSSNSSSNSGGDKPQTRNL